MYDQSFFNNESTANVNSPAAKKGQVRRLQSVVPVVIRQLRDHPEDEFKLFGMPTHILNIVGILRSYEVQSTKATYHIEDHTGSIQAIWWLENDNDAAAPNLPPVKEGSYVQVFGSLRMQDGEKIIMVLKMFLVDDANIVTSHLLQVIHTRLEAEAMSKIDTTAQIRANNPGSALANSMSFMEVENSVETGNSGLTPLQSKIFKLLQSQNNNPAGMHKQAVLKHFAPNQAKEVNQALDFLICEGHAYSTIDNDHFKATDDI